MTTAEERREYSRSWREQNPNYGREYAERRKAARRARYGEPEPSAPTLTNDLPLRNRLQMASITIAEGKRWMEFGAQQIEDGRELMMHGLRALDAALAEVQAETDPFFASDRDGTATAAANGDLPVPQDCHARPEGIAQ